MLLNFYILIWLFACITCTVLMAFNFLTNDTTNPTDKNFFEKLIPDIENSFYRENASWTDIIFLHLSILALMRFLLDLFSDSNSYFPQLTIWFGELSPAILALLHIFIYTVLWYLFVVSGGKLAHTLGRRKKTILKDGKNEDVECFSSFQFCAVLCLYIAVFLIFMFI